MIFLGCWWKLLLVDFGNCEIYFSFLHSHFSTFFVSLMRKRCSYFIPALVDFWTSFVRLPEYTSWSTLTDMKDGIFFSLTQYLVISVIYIFPLPVFLQSLSRAFSFCSLIMIFSNERDDLTTLSSLTVDDVAFGSFLLDITYQRQQAKSCTYCCSFIFCLALFRV